MCTLAWLRQPGGFLLWHSRDERRSRGVAIPPAVGQGQGTRWIAPRDSDSGGTWVGVNTHGVVVGIANLFGAGPSVPPARKISRGLLVEELLGSPTTVQVARRMASLDLKAFEPFTLVALNELDAPLLLRWDRVRLAHVPPLGENLLVTSAGGSQAIEEQRTALFHPSTGVTAEAIESLYRAPPESARASICVHSAEVSTVSLTRIEVAAEQVSLTYTPGQPCRTPAGPVIVLERYNTAGEKPALEASAP